MNTQETGFTLIEFMVVVSISAILLFVAVPGFYGMLQNNRIASMTNSLSATFHYARSEAIRRGITIGVCSAANASYTECGTAAQWGNGWIVFTDNDGNNDIDASSDLLKVHEALPTGTTVTADRNIVTYSSSGFVSNNAFNISLTGAGCYGDSARNINISPSGRLAITRISC